MQTHLIKNLTKSVGCLQLTKSFKISYRLYLVHPLFNCLQVSAFFILLEFRTIN